MAENYRDSITISDENGEEKEFFVEALFDMEEESYALLLDEVGEMMVMRVEGYGDEQYLVGIEDENEKSALLDAYQIAVDNAPADHEQ